MCVCPDAYVLDTDGHTCKFAYPTPPMLLLADQQRVLKLNVGEKTASEYASETGKIVSVSYDPSTSVVYIGDVVAEKIKR